MPDGTGLADVSLEKSVDDLLTMREQRRRRHLSSQGLQPLPPFWEGGELPMLQPKSRSVLSEFAGSLAHTIGPQNVQMMGAGLAAMGVVQGSETMYDAGRAVEDFGRDDIGWGEPATMAPVKDFDSLLKWMAGGLGQGLGSIAPPLAGGVLGGLAGVAVGGPPGAAAGAFAGAVTPNLALLTGEAVTQFKEEGVDPVQASQVAVAIAPAMAALDALGIMKILQGPGRKLKQNVFRYVAQRMLHGATVEAATEMAQGVIREVAAAAQTGDAKALERANHILEEGIVAAMTGGVVGGAGGAVSAARRPQEPGPEGTEEDAEGDAEPPEEPEAMEGETIPPEPGGPGEPGVPARPQDVGPTVDASFEDVTPEEPAPDQRPRAPGTIVPEAPKKVRSRRKRKTEPKTPDVIVGEGEVPSLEELEKDAQRTVDFHRKRVEEGAGGYRIEGAEEDLAAAEKRLADIRRQREQAAAPKRIGTRRRGKQAQAAPPDVIALPDERAAEQKPQKERKQEDARKAREARRKVAEAAKQADTTPTKGQIEAGNYKKGHVRIQGLDISIENPKGSTRSGTAPDGTEWSVAMPAHYGYIRGTEGADEEQVDVYVGDNPESGDVWVVYQDDPDTGAFDEHKAFVGFDSAKQVRDTYDAAFDDGKGPMRRGLVRKMSMDEFKDWMKDPVAFDRRRDFDEIKAALDRSRSSYIEGLRDLMVANASKGRGKKKRIEDATIKRKAGQAGFLETLRQRYDEDPDLALDAKTVKEWERIYLDSVDSSAKAHGDITRADRTDATELARLFAKAVEEDEWRDFVTKRWNEAQKRQPDKKPIKKTEPTETAETKDESEKKPDETQETQETDQERKDRERREQMRALMEAKKPGSKKDDKGKRGDAPADDKPADTAERPRKKKGKGKARKAGKKAEAKSESGEIFTQESVDAARNDFLNTLGSGLTPQAIKYLFMQLGRYVEQGVRKLADAVERLRAEIGDAYDRVAEYVPTMFGSVMHFPFGGRDVGFDPELQTLALEETQQWFEQNEGGDTSFDAYAEHMRGIFGEIVDPYLPTWYESVRGMPGVPSQGMTPRDDLGGIYGRIYDEVDATPPYGGDQSGAGPGSGSNTGTGGTSTGPVGGGPKDPADATDEQAGRGDKNRTGGGPDGNNAGLPRKTDAEYGPIHFRPGSHPRPEHNVRLATLGAEGDAADPLQENRTRREKAQDNLAALLALRRIFAEERPATTEEQQLLSLYVGWGGIKDMFPDAAGKVGRGFETMAEQLRQLLTPQDYATAQRSIQYAHYTSQLVIDAMWDIAAHLGFKGGRILEPGMGLGHFAGLMPDDVAGNALTDYTGIEMDGSTAAIAEQLYGAYDIRHADFTQLRLIPDSYDLAIGNPPFSSRRVQLGPDYPTTQLTLHDYFFVKSLDALKPGGILMFVTSAGTLNKKDSTARKLMQSKADFLGAIRLPGGPDGAFAQNAMTEVTTDIVVMRKRKPGEQPADDTWTESIDVHYLYKYVQPSGNRAEKDITIPENKWFSRNPGWVLGEGGPFDTLTAGVRFGVRPWTAEEIEASRKGPGKVLVPWRDMLFEMAGRFPADVFDARPGRVDTTLEELPDPDNEGSFYVDGRGRLRYVRNGLGRLAEELKGLGSKPVQERVKALVRIRDPLRKVFAANQEDDLVAGNAARAELNEAYDRFVKKYGPLNEVVLKPQKKTPAEREKLWDEARLDAEESGMPFDYGSFVPNNAFWTLGMKDRAAERKAQREAWETKGRSWDPGTFDIDDVEPNINMKFPNMVGFESDPEYWRVKGIEDVDVDDATGEQRISKGAIFERNVMGQPKQARIATAHDAMLAVLGETGTFDLGAIAEKWGKPVPATIEDLGDAVFRLPGDAEIWTERSEYLSGDVKTKLAEAERAASTDGQYARNVQALQEVIPEDLVPSQISFAMQSHWIPDKAMEGFLADLGYNDPVYRRTRDGDVDFYAHGSSAVAAQWTVRDSDGSVIASDGELLAALFTLGRAPEIFDESWEVRPNGKRKKVKTLNKRLTQLAVAKAEIVKRRFKQFMETSEEGREATDVYNERYRRYVPRKFDGRWVDPVGLNTDIVPRDRQMDAVARMILTGTSYLAHAVGFGKTLTSIIGMMEMRRLGLIGLPMVSVPKPVLNQWGMEWQKAYPAARIMVADPSNLNPDSRKEYLSRLAMRTDLDAVILSKESLAKIPISVPFASELAAQERAAIHAAQASGMSRVQAQRLEENLEAHYRKATENKDQVLTFEQLGVDFLVIDEAHQFRKMNFSTTMQVKGINPRGSGRSFDLMTKLRYLQTRDASRAAVFLSGSPVENTMAEIYSIGMYLMPQRMRAMGVGTFDQWAAQFGSIEDIFEFTAAQDFKFVQRFAKLVNVDELRMLLFEVMDIVGEADMKRSVARPRIGRDGEGRETVAVPPTLSVTQHVAMLRERHRHVEARDRRRRGPPERGEDNKLVIIGDGRLASIDMRLVDPAAPNDPGSKLNVMIANIIKIHNETANHPFYRVKPGTTEYEAEPYRHGPATQIVFADLGLRGAGFNIIDEMRRQFRQAGIPTEQFADIRDYDTPAKKRQLFADMNQGKIRILIGHPETLGTGVNVQRQLFVVHNLTALWNPGLDTQRNGRAYRFGNENKWIRIVDYGTEGTIDILMLQIMATKSGFIEVASSTARTAHDISPQSMYAQMSATLVPDERVTRAAELDRALERMRDERISFEQGQMAVRRRQQALAADVRSLEYNVEQQEAIAADYVDTTGAKFSMGFGKGGEYTVTPVEQERPAEPEPEPEPEPEIYTGTFTRRKNTSGRSTIWDARIPLEGNPPIVSGQEVHVALTKRKGAVVRGKGQVYHIYSDHAVATFEEVNEPPRYERPVQPPAPPEPETAKTLVEAQDKARRMERDNEWRERSFGQRFEWRIDSPYDETTDRKDANTRFLAAAEEVYDKRQKAVARLDFHLVGIVGGFKVGVRYHPKPADRKIKDESKQRKVITVALFPERIDETEFERDWTEEKEVFNRTWEVDPGDGLGDMVGDIEKILQQIPADLETMRTMLERRRAALESAREVDVAAWDRQDEYEAMNEELQDLQAELLAAAPEPDNRLPELVLTEMQREAGFNAYRNPEHSAAAGVPRLGDHQLRLGTGTGMPVETVLRVVARVAARWDPYRTPEIRVFESYDFVSPFVKRDAAPVPEGVRAMFIQTPGNPNGAVWLFADAHSTADDVRRTLMHEVVGHYSMQDMLGDQFAEVLALTAQARDRPGIKEAFDLAAKLYEGASMDTLASETVAIMAELGTDVPIMRRVLSRTRRFMRGIGFRVSMSHDELRTLLLEADRRIAAAPDRRWAAAVRDAWPSMPESARPPGPTPYQAKVQYALDGMAEENPGTKRAPLFEATRPVETFFRLLTVPFGGIDEKGDMKLTRPMIDAAGRILREWKPPKAVKGSERSSEALEWLRHGWLNRYGTPKEFVRRERERFRDQHVIMSEMVGYLKDLADAKVGRHDARILQEILEGQPLDDERLNKLAEPIRTSIDKMGRELVRLGLLSSERYHENLGRYLHRSYRLFEFDQPGIVKMARRMAGRRRRGLQPGDEFKRRGRSQGVESMKRLLKDVPEDFHEWASKWPTWEMWDRVSDTGKVTKRVWRPAGFPEYMLKTAIGPDWTYKGRWDLGPGKRDGKIYMRQDWTEEQREEWKEIRDARFNIIRTFELLAHDVAAGRFYQDIADNPAWFSAEKPASENIVDASSLERFYSTVAGIDWVRVPSTRIHKSNTPRWGALAGGWIRAPLWRDLAELDKMQRPGTWQWLLSEWKQNKTTRSPIVHFNNTVGNVILAELHDFTAGDIARALVEFARKGEMFREASEAGVFQSGYVRVEINRVDVDRVVERIIEEVRAEEQGKSSMRDLFLLFKRMDQAMTKAYRWEDEVFRLASFMRDRARGAKIEEAAQNAIDRYLNYDIRAPWPNALRRTILPFLSYTYAFVPVWLKAVASKPWKIAKLFTLFYLLQMLGYALVPGEGEEDERRVMADRDKGWTWAGMPKTLRLPLTTASGDPLYLGMTRLLPGGGIADVDKGQIELPEWMMASGPILIASEVFLNRVSFTGKDIVDSTDTRMEATQKRLMYLWRSLMPNALWIPGSWDFDRTVQAMTGETDIFGRSYDDVTAVVRLFGPKLYPFDMNAQRTLRAFEINKDLQEYRKKMWRLQNDRKRNRISDWVYARRMESIRAGMERLAERMKEIR